LSFSDKVSSYSEETIQTAHINIR